MKLLFDENLSRRIVPFVQDIYPLSTQVALVGLEQTDDKTLQDYSKAIEQALITDNHACIEIL